MHDGATFDGLVIVAGADLARTLRRGERGETLAGLRARLREALSSGVELANPVTVRLALARVAPAVVADDPWLGPIARRGGRAWLRLVDAMDEAVGAIQSQRDALTIVARGTDTVALRARLLVRLDAALERSLTDLGLVDPRRDADQLADVVAHADARSVLDALSASTLLARGIVEWTPKDLALWRVLDATLSRVGGRASIELPVFDRPLDGERQPDPLDMVIEAVAAALDDAPLTESLSPALGDLRLGSHAAPEVRVPTELRRADGAVAQGRAVADAVHAGLADGATPDDVLVGLVGDDEASALAVLRALEALHIPSADARPMHASRSNLLALAQATLDVAARGAPRAEVARLLRSSYVDARRVTGEPDAGTAERAVRTLARCLEETTTVKGAAPGEHLAATVAAAARVAPVERARMIESATRVGAMLQRVSAGGNRAELVRGVRELYRELGFEGVAGEAVHASTGERTSGLDAADTDARRCDSEAWGMLASVLDAYERAVSRLALTQVDADLETFRHELAWAVARSSTKPSVSRGVVRVMRLADLPTEPCALVVLADTHAWPDGRPHARLIPGALEERIRRASDPAFQPISLAGAAEALARLALATSRAGRVVLAYRTHDHDGASLTPAPILGWLARSVPVTSWRPTTPLHRPLTDRERTLATLARNPSRATHDAVAAARRATLERQREEAFGLALPRNHPLVTTLPRGESFEAILTDESGGERPLPASAIDTLANCVFQGFVTQVLRPKRLSQAHDIADAREEGILTHAALEAAFRATGPLWSKRPRDRETILRLGVEAANHVLEASPLATPLVRSVIARAKGGVLAVLEWSLADEAWDFAAAEQTFGGSDGWAVLSLDRPGTHVAIRGRIDRVDVAHEGSAVRVIDYKTRASSAENHTARFGVTAFQLALYARVAKDALERAGAAGIDPTTQRLRPGDAPKRSQERWTAAHAVEQGVERFEEAILDRVIELRSGRVEVRPVDDGACAYCAYEGVCRKPRFAPSQPDDDDASEDDDS